MKASDNKGPKVPVPTSWTLGVRARLLLAFFGIAGFAVLAAAAGMYAFREVGGRLDVVNTRIPPTLSALELSRSAERIIAAAPALLAVTDRDQRDAIKSALVAEVERLKARLADLKGDDARPLPLGQIEPIVSSLSASLASLDDVVARRLDAAERIRTLRRGVFQTNDETQRLLAPWLEVVGSEIAMHVAAREAEATGPGDRPRRLAALIELQRLMRSAQSQVSAVAEMLAEASTADQPRRLDILAFQLGLALRELEATAGGLDSKLRVLFLEQVARLGQFAAGAGAITEARKQELVLVGEGERLLADTGRLSAQLTATVDRLGIAAKRDISEAIRDALSVQRLSARVLIGLVALSLLTSVLIVWLYVGGNIVRRLTALSAGTLAIAGGRLHAPVTVQGNDEIAAMGQAVEVFRQNAIELERLLEERKQTASRLEHMVEARTRELSEALEQQTATADVLKAISRSPFELQIVLDTLCQSAARLCNADHAWLFRRVDDVYCWAASYGHSHEDHERIKAFMRAQRIVPGRGTLVGRTALEQRPVLIPDALTDPEYKWSEAVRIGKYRTTFGTPLLREGETIGVLALTRSDVRPFAPREIDLATTFADQAVIAIENARLFDEVQARTRELGKSLEKQTATAEILRVISTSPTDVQRVFEAIVQAAVALCEGLFANVFRFDGEHLHFVASHNVGPSYVELLQVKYPMRPDRSQVSGRVLLTKSIVRLEDALADPDYDQRFPRALGWRRMLGVPMLREDNPVGVLVVGWAEPGPVDPAQEELLTTFADQAVIAIENARLFDEVQARTRELSESLQQQTATADVLKVISRSTFDLQTVLDTLVEAAARLCQVPFCQVFRFDGRLIHFAAHYGLSSEAVDDIRRAYPMPPGRASAVARAILSGSIEQIPDIGADPDYTRGHFARIMNFRSVVAVPMLKDNRPIGAIAMARTDTGRFPERQIELLRTFADQAVIAIENARLFDEIQDKTRRLEIADKYKSHFLASASHDLRQPLHALNLFVAQLRAESDPAKRERLIAHIDAAVSAMNELFESLLDMTKLEAGILDPHPTEFPVDQILRRMETTFADSAREKGLRLAVVPSRAWVRSDLILLERIVLNLVSNAVRYTSRGGVVVGCRRRGEELRIDVCDSGPGIPKDQQQDIFVEYYRLAGAEPDRGGFGLGLAIVDRLGRLLGHSVEVDSRPGRGSRFSVSVPRVAEPRGAVAATVSPAVVDPASGKLVLVIDDDPLVLDGMGGILRSWGCTILTADSEDAALASLAAQQQRPDLIISDYRLANGRTGIEAIQRVRAALDAVVPAFLISGDTAPERLRDARRSGFHLLHKPVPPMRLRAMLNQLLKGRDAHRAAE